VSLIHDPTRFTGQVVSATGERIGRAGAMLFDPQIDRLAWIRVDQGPFNTRHTLVPLQGAYQAAGQVVVPFDRDTVRHAPKVSRTVALAGPVRQKFEAYYGHPGHR